MFGKPQMNIHYLKTLTLEVLFMYIICFFSRINVQCMSSLVYTVYTEAAIRVEGFCKKKYSSRFRKFRRKTPVLESLFNKVPSLTPILKNICQRLLLHCTRTTHCYLSVLLYIQHFLPHHHCFYC